MKRIYFTVTNDLSFDQRMHRICGSLAEAGFGVTLVGRKLATSLPLQPKNFRQKRISCFFNKGFLFYAEYNLRLFFFLLHKKMDALCAIDLDTILPCLFISKLKGIPRVYDAHEYFTELKEVRTRPRVKKVWLGIERFTVPKFFWGYTVSDGLANQFKGNYGKNYSVIRNVPLSKKLTPSAKTEKFLLYQGAVNEGRGFEFLIPAMKNINSKLVVCGDGNFMKELKQLIYENEVAAKVELKGMLLPDELQPFAQQATIGINLVEEKGLNQFYSLANKFFDYVQAGLPQITMNYPEYRRVNDDYPVAILLDNLSAQSIASAINALLANEPLQQQMRANCLRAREVYCWQNEEKKLLAFYQTVFK